MRISYIPENILKARADCKFFFRDTWLAAAYNFKVSVYATHVKEHDKFQEKAAKVDGVAKPAIDGTQRTSKISVCNRIAHFCAHIGMALALCIPPFNFIIFLYVALKAKEHREEASLASPMVTPLEEDPSLKQAQIQESTSSSLTSPIRPQPQVKVSPQTSSIQKGLPSSILSQPQSPRVLTKTPSQINITPKTEIKPQTSPPSRLSAQTEKPFMAEPEDQVLKNLHRNITDETPQRTASGYGSLVLGLYFSLFVSEVPDNAIHEMAKYIAKIESKEQGKVVLPKKVLSPQTIRDFLLNVSLFPKGNQKLDVELENLKNILMNKVDGIVRTSVGIKLMDKAQNVQTNLINFRQFLNNNKDFTKDAPLKGTFNSSDLRVYGTSMNPYDILRDGISNKTPQEFLNFIQTFVFYERHGLIHINPNIKSG